MAITWKRVSYVQSLLRKLFRWAVDREDIQVSPLHGMKAPKAVVSRRRVLGQEEFMCLWLVYDRAGWPWERYVRLLILSMQRRQEVAEMDWLEINLEAETWTLPAERAKSDQAHIVPLNGLVIDQLMALRPKTHGLVFTTTGGTAVSGFSKVKTTLDDEMKRIMAEHQKSRGGESAPILVPEWRLHDIRRTGATNLQALGIPIEVTEAGLKSH